MKSKRVFGYLFLCLGTLLIAGCVILGVMNKLEDASAGQSAAEAVAALEAAGTAPTLDGAAPVVETTGETIPETTSGEPTDPTDPPTLSSQFLDGHEYVGYLVFPSLDRKLPVMKIKYVQDLQIAPCLERGSPHTNDAVICAHNYPSHFGPIRDWKGGEEVQFIDLDGRTIDYTVSVVETIAPTDVEKVMNSDHDLVLYTCTTGGQSRVMLGCDRAE